MTVQPGLCQTWLESQIVGFSHAYAHIFFTGTCWCQVGGQVGTVFVLVAEVLVGTQAG